MLREVLRALRVLGVSIRTPSVRNPFLHESPTTPSITVSSVRVVSGRTIITFDVKDDHSPIRGVEFSDDGQRWRGVFPVDGIADSRDEHYELPIDGELSERGLTLRASDAMNNVSTTHVDAPSRRR